MVSYFCDSARNKHDLRIPWFLNYTTLKLCVCKMLIIDAGDELFAVVDEGLQRYLDIIKK